MQALTQIALMISVFAVSQIIGYLIAIKPLKAQEKRIDDVYNRVIEEFKKES